MRYDYVHLTPNVSNFSNDCEYWNAKKEHRNQCIAMIREYDSKWSDAARPNGHEPHIKQIDREIKNIEDEINKTCK